MTEPADRMTTVPGVVEQGLVQPEGVNAGSDDVVEEGSPGAATGRDDGPAGTSDHAERD